MYGKQKPLRIINSSAPIRICDNGGWTDTWFAEYGKLFNIGVYPYAEVQIEVYPADTVEERIIINAENFGERYVLQPENVTRTPWVASIALHEFRITIIRNISKAIRCFITFLIVSSSKLSSNFITINVADFCPLFWTKFIYLQNNKEKEISF